MATYSSSSLTKHLLNTSLIFSLLVTASPLCVKAASAGEDEQKQVAAAIAAPRTPVSPEEKYKQALSSLKGEVALEDPLFFDPHARVIKAVEQLLQLVKDGFPDARAFLGTKLMLDSAMMTEAGAGLKTQCSRSGGAFVVQIHNPDNTITEGVFPLEVELLFTSRFNLPLQPPAGLSPKTHLAREAQGLLALSKTPLALNSLGLMYMWGQAGSYLRSPAARDAEAQACFEKERTPEASYNLARLYETNKIGAKLTPKERLQKVVALRKASKLPLDTWLHRLPLHEMMGSVGEEVSFPAGVAQQTRAAALKFQWILESFSEENQSIRDEIQSYSQKFLSACEKLPESVKNNKANAAPETHVSEMPVPETPTAAAAAAGAAAPSEDEITYKLGRAYLTGQKGKELSQKERDEKGFALLEGTDLPDAKALAGLKHMFTSLHGKTQVMYSGKQLRMAPGQIRRGMMHLKETTILPGNPPELATNMSFDLNYPDPSPSDQLKALSLLREAHTADACNNLGLMCLWGMAPGIPQGIQDAQAEGLFKKSATPESKYNLGFMMKEKRAGLDLSPEQRHQESMKLLREFLRDASAPLSEGWPLVEMTDFLLSREIVTQPGFNQNLAPKVALEVARLYLTLDDIALSQGEALSDVQPYLQKLLKTPLTLEGAASAAAAAARN